MELVTVNGASSIARSLQKQLASKVSSIKLLDQRAYRQGTYALQRSLPSSVSLSKQMINSQVSLDYALEGAENVLYVSHDYLAMASDKNKQLELTARLAKKHGVKKLVSVMPIEHDLYYTEEEKNAIQKRVESQTKALEENHNQVIIAPSLIYGQGGYLYKYLVQCVLAGSIPAKLNSSATEYMPIHEDDLAKAVAESYDNFDSLKDKQYTLSGSESISIAAMVEKIEEATGKTVGSTKAQTNQGISDLIEEFFVGIAHDKNMANLASFFDNNKSVTGLLTEQDFWAATGTSPSKTLADALSEGVKDEDVQLPTFTDYKLVALD